MALLVQYLDPDFPVFVHIPEAVLTQTKIVFQQIENKNIKIITSKIKKTVKEATIYGNIS